MLCSKQGDIWWWKQHDEGHQQYWRQTTLTTFQPRQFFTANLNVIPSISHIGSSLSPRNVVFQNFLDQKPTKTPTRQSAVITIGRPSLGFGNYAMTHTLSQLKMYRSKINHPEFLKLWLCFVSSMLHYEQAPVNVTRSIITKMRSTPNPPKMYRLMNKKKKNFCLRYIKSLWETSVILLVFLCDSIDYQS